MDWKYVLNEISIVVTIVVLVGLCSGVCAIVGAAIQLTNAAVEYKSDPTAAKIEAVGAITGGASEGIMVAAKSGKALRVSLAAGRGKKLISSTAKARLTKSLDTISKAIDVHSIGNSIYSATQIVRPRAPQEQVHHDY